MRFRERVLSSGSVASRRGVGARARVGAPGYVAGALACALVCACAGGEDDGGPGAAAVEGAATPSSAAPPAPARTPAGAPPRAPAAPAARPTSAAPAVSSPSATAAPPWPAAPMLGVRRDGDGFVIGSGAREARWMPRGGARSEVKAVPLDAAGSRWALAAAWSGGVDLVTLDGEGALAVLYQSANESRNLDVRLSDLDGDGAYELVEHRTLPARREIDIMLPASVSRYVRRFDGERFVPRDRPRGGVPPLEPDWERLRRAITAELGVDCIEHDRADVGTITLVRASSAPPPGSTGIGSGLTSSSSRPATVGAGLVTARVCVARGPELRAVVALVELRDRNPRVLALEPIGPYHHGPLPERCAGGLEELSVHVVNGGDDPGRRAIVPVFRDGEAAWRARLFTYDGATLAATGESAALECRPRPLPSGLPFAVEPGREGRAPRLVVPD